ncbi:MAG: glycosyltransferase family 4 protein [Candidatus Pacebacteria bacterium]|nr:glycosyltransferase family 4 protein [Candidatus Paceibacterota bacterium]
MEKKRVLVIIPDRFEKSTGGMGANSAPLFDALSSEYDFYIAGFPLAGTNPPRFAKEYREVSSAFTEIKQGVISTIAAQARYLSAAIRFPKPDLIYAFDWSIYHAAVEAADYFGVPLVARMCLSPILLSMQGYTFGLNLADPLQKALHNALCEMEIRGLRRADRIVQVSRGYAKLYEKVSDFSDKTRLVINGIDLDAWRRELSPFEFPGTRARKIVFLGRFAEMKGIVPLAKARVPDDTDLIFIGDMEASDRVCANAIQKKVENEDNVHYVGPLYGEDKIRALQSADALIVPSYHEPFGGVGLEGLAAGCTVLSSRAGGLADYLTDETSIYCGTTPAEIEDAYAKLRALPSEARAAMCEAGFQTCRELTIDSATRQLRSVFEEVS